jgi:hypothetical protein
MSQSFAHGRGSTKNTCARCKRTVRVVVIDGQRIETDTELIAVVVNGEKQRRVAYRIHAEQCERYKLDAEKKAFALARKKQQAAVVGAPYTAPPVPKPADTRTADQRRRDLLKHYSALAKARDREIARSMR